MIALVAVVGVPAAAPWMKWLQQWQGRRLSALVLAALRWRLQPVAKVEKVAKVQEGVRPARTSARQAEVAVYRLPPRLLC